MYAFKNGFGIAAWLAVMLGTQELPFSSAATCVEREDQIQGYLISSEPPFDNYYNISKAVYPSVDLPSLLIKVTVRFLATADYILIHQSGSSRSLNVSNVSITGADVLQTTGNETRTNDTNDTNKFTWSASCLYVSGGDISMTAMNFFSLFAIWPNRRERHLQISLPQFCKGYSSDSMIYFLSTLQDIAVTPKLPDPSLNTVECVIEGHGKAPSFAGLKQLFHAVCWCILCISLVFSQFVSQWLIVQLKDWYNNESASGKVEAVMLLSCSVFVLGLIFIFIAWNRSQESEFYVFVFFVCVLLVFVRRAVWCIKQHYNIDKCHMDGRQRIGMKFYKYFYWCTFSEGHEVPSKNAISFLVLYPAVFMACHHLLWILLGIITEPFWGISVLVAVLSVSAALFFLTCELYKDFPAKERTCTCNRTNKCLACNYCRDCEYYTSFTISLILVLGGFLAFLLLIFLLLVVAQSFLSESLISSLVQNGLVFFSTLWFGKSGYLKLDKAKTKPETKNPAAEEYPLHVHVNDEDDGNHIIDSLFN